MKVIAGLLYIEDGERFPFKCPVCGAYVEYAESKTVTCPSCDVKGTAEEFSDVEFRVLKPN